MNKLLNRLLLWQKFVLLGMFGVILASVPLTLFVIESNKGIDAATLEQSGIAPARALLKAVQLTQQHRGLSALVLGGNPAVVSSRNEKADAAEKAYASIDSIIKNDVSDPALAAAWRQVHGNWTALAGKVSQRSISIKTSYTDHTALVAEMLKVNGLLLDYFGLSLDPEMDSYYLMDATLIQAPALTEALGKTRAKGAGLLITKTATVEDRAVMVSFLDKVRDRYEAMASSLAKAAASNPVLKRKLSGATEAALASATKVMQLAQAQIVTPEQISYSSADYVVQFTDAIDTQFKLNAAAVSELEAILTARQASSRTTKNMLIGAVLMLALFAALIGYLIARSITVPLSEAVVFAKQVAAGDLTVRVQVNSKDEVGQLMQALKDMNGSLVRIVGEVRSGTETIATASSQIAAGNLDLSSRTEEQASSLEETASSMEELTGTVKQNADSARQANQLAASASEVARKGGKVVSQVVDTMGSINESAKKIVDIIGVIDGIAFQTNILALNAAVEAARAGEQGRGFAVVASEVRNLAQRSAAAAKEIKTLIGDSVEKVDAGSKLVNQAGATMDEIVESVKRVTDIMSEITAASREQTSGIEQINQAIAQMDEVTQQNAALVEEAAAAAESLQDQAGNLAQVVSVFKLDGVQEAMAAPLSRVNIPKPLATKRNPTKVVAANTGKFKQAANARSGAEQEWEQF